MWSGNVLDALAGTTSIEPVLVVTNDKVYRERQIGLTISKTDEQGISDLHMK